jgi:Peptidase family M1 domain/Peptidase M1 N-terminal domain
MRARRLLALLGATALPAVTVAAAAADAAEPVPTALVVRAPRVAAGGTLPIAGALRAPGRVRLDVYLAARRAGGRVWLGERRLPGPRRRFAARLRVARGLPSGRYEVRVCARRGPGAPSACRSAGPVRITGGAPAVPARFVTGARSIGDPLYPSIGNGGYDAQVYRLRLAYDPAVRVLRGRATLLATATQDLRALSLDLQGLRVRSVRVDGRPAFSRRRATKLLITPTRGIPAGAALRVTVAYGGRVRPVHEPGGGTTGFVPTRAGAVVYSQPIGAQNWFPNDNTPADKATFDVTLRVPAGLEVLGNGRLVARRRTRAGTAFRWVERFPMATELATATLGRYEIVRSRTRAGLPLLSAIERGGPGSPSPSRRALAHRRALLGRIGPVLRTLERLLGPYPFESAGAIVAERPDFGDALETQTRPLYVGEFDAETQIHELAHQWLGDSVTITRWSDVWLQEGFATWAEWWAGHALDPRAPTTAQAAARAYRPSARTRRGRLRERWRPLIVQRRRDLFGDAPYERGAMLLEALRQRVGDPTFRRILSDWLAEHRYGNVTTDDFVALSERDSGTELDALFDDWLHTVGKPTVTPPRADPAPPPAGSRP